MKQAEYNTGDQILILDVLAQNKDGTLELGTAPDKLKVGKCPQHEQLKEGTARILSVEKDEPAEEEAQPKKAKKAAGE